MKNTFCLVLALFIGIRVVDLSAEEYVGQILNVRDVGVESNFADYQMGHFNRGRSLLCDDFDRDGLKDCYVGNPGDATFVMRNLDGSTMVLGQELSSDEIGSLSWGGCLLDFDNDGFIDIFGTQGGNECFEFDKLWHNQGDGTFVNVAEHAGVLGPIDELGFPDPIASASCTAGDVNGDGFTDVFVNNNSRVACQQQPTGDKVNVLWLNNGDGTFQDITEASGLDASTNDSRHSFFFDADGDGDPDLFEANFQDPNVLWINRVDEIGVFVEETVARSAPEEDLRYPWATFAACPGEMNGDDLEDIVAFQRGGDRRGGPIPAEHDCGVESTDWSYVEDEIGSGPYRDGHAIFINRPEGFVNEVDAMGVGASFYGDNGVMGSQLGDLNGDGWLDIYIANGGPASGAPDQWWVSDPLQWDDPFYTDESGHINFPAPDPGGVLLPEFPYRGHGTAIVDIDNDGATELLVVNGGPDHIDDPLMQEPNRWFEIDLDSSYSSLRARLVGDGVNVSRDAIGSRVCVTASNDSETWETCRWVRSGSCFSASNGFELFFGLKNAISIDDVEIRWRDGAEQHATASIGDSILVRR